MLTPETIRKLHAEDPEYAAKTVKDFRKAMIVLARQDPSLFCQYVLRNEETNEAIRQAPVHTLIHKTLLESRRSLIWAYPGLGKCCQRGTKILLADGSWERVENLRNWTAAVSLDPITDKLIPATLRATNNGWRPVKKIMLENGMVHTVTLEHPLMDDSFQWRQAKDLKPGNSILVLASTPIDGPLPESFLPAEEAELLGILLSGKVDGDIVILSKLHKTHYFARRKELIRKAGWDVNQAGLRVRQVNGRMGPVEFLRTFAILSEDGYPQELTPSGWRLGPVSMKALIQGLFMCISNNISDPRYVGRPKQKDYRTQLSNLAWIPNTGAARLFQLIGLRAGIRVVTRRMPRMDYGLWLSWPLFDSWVFWGKTPEEDNTALAEKHPGWYFSKIKAVANFPEAETWAVEVQEAHHTFIGDGVLSHNTNQVSIGHVLWRIGKNPATSIGILCASAGMAAKVLSSIKMYIAESPEFRDVFPGVVPGAIWNEQAITVGRESFRKDPTIQAIGLTGKFLGSRMEGLVMDDVDNLDTTLTVEMRNITEQRVRKQAVSRIGSDGWICAIGNVWAEDDMMHRLAKSGWKQLRFPVMFPNGESADPERFPMDRIAEIRDVDQGPIEFERLYMLRARIEGEARFKRAWIDKALERGNQMTLCPEGLPNGPPAGCRTITGVDLGIKKKATSDPTAICTILEIPKAEGKFEYQLLNLVMGRWDVFESMENIREQQRLFSSVVWVENNAAQDLLVQIMGADGFPVKAFNTGRNKHDPTFGVESIASEMATGGWILPSWDGTLNGVEEVVHDLVQGMLAYTMGSHTSDALMALWIAREAARTSRMAVTSEVEFGFLNLKRR